ncbi:MAG: hypothetical protein LBU51_08345 [Bacteroidales bacterium]|jgi:hypothetical protein|nr:hypothetical protein [Bacteroidales bacterium]
MKKTVIILIVTMLVGNMYAQPRLATDGNDFLLSKYFQPFIALNVDNGSYTGLVTPLNNTKNAITKEKMNASIIKFKKYNFDQDWFLIPTHFNAEATFDSPHNLIMLFSEYDDSSNQYTIYKELFAKKSSSYTSNPFKLGTYAIDKREGKLLYTASSSDHSKHLVLAILTNNSNRYKGLFYLIIGANGEIVSQNEINPSFKYNQFKIQGVSISDEGDIFIAVNSFNESRKKTETENIYLLKIQNQILSSYEIETPYFTINSLSMKLLFNNNILISGYCKEPTKGVASVFSLPFNGNKNSFGQFSNVELSKVVKDRYPNSNLNGASFSFVAIDMVELSNNKIALIGENRAVVESHNDKKGTTSYTYHTRNILTTFIDLDGEIRQTSVVNKYQISEEYPFYNPNFYAMGVSFDYFRDEDGLYYIFNDLIDNYLSPNQTPNIYEADHYKNSCTMAVRVADDSKLEKTMINRYDNTNEVYYKLAHNDEDTEMAVLTFVGKTNYTLRKLAY